MPRNLLFQNNLFICPYPVLGSSGCAKLLYNCSTKANPQNFSDLFLLSYSAHLGASPEVKAKGILLHQLLQVFQRPKWKKELFPISTSQQLGSRSVIPCSSSDPPDPSVPPGLPEESWVGKGFISLSTIFWYKALKLNGSTVKGSVPVSMAYMFTPLKENRQRKKPKWSGTRKNPGFGDCTSSLMSDSYCRVDAPSLRTLQIRLKGAPDPAGDVPALCNNNYKLQK